MTNILHLPIKKQWFDMIKSGAKTEEYRDITDYYCRRLVVREFEMEHQVWEEAITDLQNPFINHNSPEDCLNYYGLRFKQFDIARFKNGYRKDSPAFDAKIKRIFIGCGDESWGAVPFKPYFVIQLGGLI